MKEIRIKTENGGMTVYIDAFFPCSQARFNKLFKIVKQFSWFNDVQKITEQLNQNFTDRIRDLEDAKSVNVSLYSRYMQEQADFRDIVESGKYPNGIRLTKEELKDFKKKRSSAMSSAKSRLAETKKIEREITALKKNLEMLGSLEM